jgi:exonuclease VII small subunit
MDKEPGYRHFRDTGSMRLVLFPIRIGFEDTADRQEGGPRPQPSTVLLVAVEEDSLQWEDGVAIALQCQEVLRRFQIFDVEVEIREGRYQPHAAATQLEEQIEPMAWSGKTNQTVLPLLSSLGYLIGYLEDQPGAGNIGLHLKLGSEESVVYGLTCRHVVENNRAPNKTYNLSEAGMESHCQYHVQANHTNFSECLEELESYHKDLERRLEESMEKQTRWDERYCHDESLKHKRPTEEDIKTLQRLQSKTAYNTKIIKLVDAISDKTQSIIGRLAFLPSYFRCYRN